MAGVLAGFWWVSFALRFLCSCFCSALLSSRDSVSALTLLCSALLVVLLWLLLSRPRSLVTVAMSVAAMSSSVSPSIRLSTCFCAVFFRGSQSAFGPCFPCPLFRICIRIRNIPPFSKIVSIYPDRSVHYSAFKSIEDTREQKRAKNSRAEQTQNRRPKSAPEKKRKAQNKKEATKRRERTRTDGIILEHAERTVLARPHEGAVVARHCH